MEEDKKKDNTVVNNEKVVDVAKPEIEVEFLDEKESLDNEGLEIESVEGKVINTADTFEKNTEKRDKSNKKKVKKMSKKDEEKEKKAKKKLKAKEKQKEKDKKAKKKKKEKAKKEKAAKKLKEKKAKKKAAARKKKAKKSKKK